jgi:hypothetical protein
LVSGGVGFVYAEQFAELYNEALCGGQFAGGNAMLRAMPGESWRQM